MRAWPRSHDLDLDSKPVAGGVALTPDADTSVTAPTGRAYLKLVLVLGALVALGPLTIDAYLPALPTLAAELAASDAQAQFTLTGIMLGLGLGQLILGPISDAVGRRRVMLSGMAVHATMSVCAAFASSIEMLTVLRVGQGVAGAAVSVAAMATVRDLFTGSQAARLLSHLTLVIGVAPILAPSLGSLLLQVTGWRGIFIALAATALAMFGLAFFGMDETLPLSRRRSASLRSTLRTYAGLFADRAFVGLIALAGLMFSALFAYVAGSSFVFQEFYGLDEQQFGLLFGLNAMGLIAATQLNPVLLRRWSPLQILSAGVPLAMVSTSALVLLAWSNAPLALIVVPLWLTMFAVGLSFPNTPALALSRHGEAAGAAAAMLGSVQFGMSSLILPLAGAVGTDSALGMAAVMAGTIWIGAVVLFAVVRPGTLSAA